jgi:hypothetical protein
MSTAKNTTYTHRFKNYVKQLLSNDLCKSPAAISHVKVVSFYICHFQEGTELYIRLFLD